MSRRSILPPALLPGPFLASTAWELGVTFKRLRANDLSGAVWGTRLPVAEAHDLRRRCEAYALRLPDYAVFSHVTAALLHALPLPLALEKRWAMDVSVPAPLRSVDLRGIHGHQLRRLDCIQLPPEGLRVTKVEHTWCDVAGMLRLRELVAVGDAILDRRHPRSTVAELADAAASFPGRRGRANLRAALPLLSDRAESPAESMIRVELVGSGLPKLRVNVDVRDNRGRFIARPDLSFVDYPLLIEYEGDYHRTDRAQWMKDIARTRKLESLGFTVMRSVSKDLADPSELIARLRMTLRCHGWRDRDDSP